MSKAQITQLLISLIGIVLAVMAFLFLPFGTVMNGVVAFVLFMAAGTASSFAYARIASIEEKIRDLRDRVDNPPA